jgi:hypothetical protein
MYQKRSSDSSQRVVAAGRRLPVAGWLPLVRERDDGGHEAAADCIITDRPFTSFRTENRAF